VFTKSQNCRLINTPGVCGTILPRLACGSNAIRRRGCGHNGHNTTYIMCRCRQRQYVAGIIRSPAAYYDERYYLSTPSSSSSSSRRVTRNTERDQWQRNSSSSGWRRHGGWAGDEQRWVGVAVSSCRTMHVRSAKTNDDVNGHALSHVHTLTYSPTTGALKAVETRLVSSRCDVESSPDQSGR